MFKKLRQLAQIFPRQRPQTADTVMNDVSNPPCCS